MRSDANFDYSGWVRLGARPAKYRTMRPSAAAGSTVGTSRSGNRRGGKVRGMKAGRQKQGKVNVAKLVQHTNKGK